MIAIVDSGTGNLASVAKAIAHAGGQAVLTGDPDVVRRADRVVVPGQGAFRDCMAGLGSGLGEAVREAIAAGRPYLGICLGLQILFEASEEAGPCAGLGILRGRVERLRPTDPRLKIPHMGWNAVHATRPDPLLADVPDGAFFYFVHSFAAVPTDPSVTLLTTDHGGPICAAVRQDNVFACQFHPEKSQRAGLALLARFVRCA